MLAAVAQKSAIPGLAFNWFDVALVLILAFGVWRGRKRGMSREFLPLSFWLTVLLVGSRYYQWVGEQLVQKGVIKVVFAGIFNERTAALVCSYLLIMLAAKIVFSFINRAVKAKLEGSNAFGNSEYYIGMVAGMLRYACITLVALAFLNAPIYTPAEIAAKKAYNKRWYGGGENDGNYIPSISDVQVNIFKESICGRFIKDKMNEMLIDTRSVAGKKKPGKN